MTNKSLIVVAGATHPAGLIYEYELQLRAAGIDFSLEPLEPMPAGANSITMRRRIAYMRRICQKFRDYSYLIATDAWDVLFYGTRQEALDKMPLGMVVSAERNCYPEAHLAPLFKGSSPWRFVNNGMLAGSPIYIEEWLEIAERTADLDILDQAWFNRRRSEGWQPLHLDTATELFYVVSATQEDGSLVIRDGRPWNTRYNTTPNFFHFSGKCPDSPFRALLRGEIEAL